MAFAGGFCAYIQGNFLNTKLGLMDGRKLDWPSYSRKFMTNLIIWLIIYCVYKREVNELNQLQKQMRNRNNEEKE